MKSQNYRPRNHLQSRDAFDDIQIVPQKQAKRNRKKEIKRGEEMNRLRQADLIVETDGEFSLARIIADDPGKGKLPFPGSIPDDVVSLYFLSNIFSLSFSCCNWSTAYLL